MPGSSGEGGVNRVALEDARLPVCWSRLASDLPVDLTGRQGETQRRKRKTGRKKPTHTW